MFERIKFHLSHATWLHIAERSFLHFFMSGTVYLISYLVLRACMAGNPDWTLRIVPGLIAVGFIGWREAYDVSKGQPLLKAYTDYASWLLGTVLAIALLYAYAH